MAVAGCSGGGPEPTYPVTGTVKLPDGKPLQGGQILFRPVEGSTYSARGDIAQDGTFELTTFEAGDGAVAGKHKVMITPAVPPELLEDARAMLGRKPIIDPSYQSLQTSPLEYTVVDDDSNNFDIVAKPPKG